MASFSLLRSLSPLRGIRYAPRTTAVHRWKSTMRAIVMSQHGGPEVLRIQTVPTPVPSNTEVLVNVEAAGVNPVDLFLREGAFMNLPTLPLILGKEAAGNVVQVGKDVRNIKVGDRVTCCLPWDGGYAEYVKCDAKFLIPLSAELSYSEGACLFVAYAIAYRALVTKCQIVEGERLFVHGASGGVGIAAIQIAKANRLFVVGTARSDGGRAAGFRAGADSMVDHSRKGYMADAHAASGAQGFNVILENCADVNLGQDLMMLAPKGRIAIVGTRRRCNPQAKPQVPTVEVNPRSLMFTEGNIMGVKLSGASPEEFLEYTRIVSEGVQNGWLRPIIAKEFSLEDAHLAHQHMLNVPAMGKLVLKMKK